MKPIGKYTMCFIEGFFIKDLDCYTDGTKKIVTCREGVLGDLLEESKEGYSTLFSSLEGVPVRVLFPRHLIESKELFSSSLEKNYVISGNLEMKVSRGTGIQDYYIVAHTCKKKEKAVSVKNKFLQAHTCNSVEKRTEKGDTVMEVDTNCIYSRN